uniref:Immunoglobulin V-set domain-containing protein n=1 Tax=Loxodonta africana TaxID=9785 RepID=G3UGK0_LOXAF
IRFPAQLLGLLLLWIPVFISSGDVVVTHSPVSLPVMLREPATISYNPSQSLQHSDGYDQQKPGQPPQLLMYRASSPRGSGTDFTLKISRVEAEDVAVYYCQQSTQVPPTVDQPCTQTSLLGVAQLP